MKTGTLLVATCTLALTLGIVPVQAETLSAKTISLDSGYVPQATTNRSMWNLWQEYQYFGESGFDALNKTALFGNPVTRALLAAGSYLAWNWANYPFFVANHELGHGTRVISMRGSPTYTWNTGPGNVSIFTFIGLGFTKYGQGADTTGSISVPSGVPSDWTLTVTAGGMNNSMMYAESLQDEVSYNTGHVLQLPSYIYARMDAFNYAKYNMSSANSDVGSLLGTWQARGYSITTDDVAAGATVSALTSFTTWAYAWSVLRYVGTGDPSVSAARIGGVTLPDVSFFQNRNGLSYRLRTSLRFADRLALPLSVEYVYRGTPTVEVSLGLRRLLGIAGVRKSGDLIQAYLCSDGGGGLRLAKDFPTGSRSFLSLGGSLFTTRSLEGERSMGYLLSSAAGVDIWLKQSWTY